MNPSQEPNFRVGLVHWITGVSIVLGCLSLSAYPLLAPYPETRNFLLILGPQLILIPAVLLILFGKRWGIWQVQPTPKVESEAKSEAEAEKIEAERERETVNQAWRAVLVLISLGCLALGTYPLLSAHPAIRSFLLILGAQVLTIAIAVLLFFGKRLRFWGHQADTSKIKPETDDERDVRWTRQTVVWFAIFGLVAASFFDVSITPFHWSQFFKFTGVSFLYAAAFFAAGALIGFLFGIPRSLRGKPKDNEGGSSGKIATDDRGFATNTNLEEISDWLTKIIVGLGLYNLRNAPGYLKRAASFFGKFCGNDYCEPVALALILYFSICGFFLGYLMARLYLPRAFARAEKLAPPEDVDQFGPASDELPINQQNVVEP